MADWEDVIKVAVIDCGDEINNREICQHADINGFPTIKYYFPFTETNDTGFTRPSEDHTGEALIVDTVNFLQQMIGGMVALNNNLTRLWPNLESLNGNSSANVSVADIWPENNEETFIVVETAESYIGRQVILDTWRRSGPHPVVERLVVATDSPALSSLGLASLPGLVVLTRARQRVLTLPAPGPAPRPAILAAIQQYRASSPLQPGPTSSEQPGLAGPGGELPELGDVTRRRYSVYLSDLEQTVVLMLTSSSEGLAWRQTLNRTEVAALVEILSVLVDLFPSQSSLQPRLVGVADWLDHQAGPVETDELVRQVGGQRGRDSWQGCAGSRPAQYGGFTCGAWQLWHYLTVAQVEAGHGIPTAVLSAMLSWVRHFFRCQGCRRDFLELMEEGAVVEREVKSYRDAVLLLWTQHNAVNLKLVGRPSDDPAFPKEFWPSLQFCPDCYRRPPASRQTADTEKIYQFLREHYREAALLREGEVSGAAGLMVSVVLTAIVIVI